MAKPPTRSGLLDAMRAASSPTIPGCKMRRILDVLSAEDRADVEAALDDPSINHVAIARVLTAAGHSTSEDPVSRHRRHLAGLDGGCSCGRAG